jgi:hypothetical protein
MAKETTHKYWCDHCGVETDVRSAVDTHFGTRYVELHFCINCVRGVLLSQVKKQGERAEREFFDYYENKGRK